jgi:hypothetical protein
MQTLLLDGISFEERFGINSDVFKRISTKILSYLHHRGTKDFAARNLWVDFFGKIHRKSDIDDLLFTFILGCTMFLKSMKSS